MASVHGITFDCANVPAVAQFWCETLGGRWTTFADVEGNEFDLIDANVRG